jgi:hypothetical protein
MSAMPAMEPAGLPGIAKEIEFLGPDELDGRPFAGVDGAPPPGAALALAHWRGSETPAELGAPTATEIAWRYLQSRPAGAPTIEVITNNHVDEDGVLAAWLLTERPDPAHAELAIAAAMAGDFAVWQDPWAARRAIALAALVEPESTSLWAVRRALTDASRVNPSGPIHRALLPHVAAVITAPERQEHLWRPRWDRVASDLALLDAGAATITDAPDADTALLRSPRQLDELAVHPRTACGTIVTALSDGRLHAIQRYESWVEFRPDGVPPRISLVPVAERLTALDREADWRADGPEIPRARLFPSDSAGNVVRTGLDPETVVEEIERERRSAGAL